MEWSLSLLHVDVLKTLFDVHRTCFNIYPFLAALMALKRKKRFEKQLAQIDGTLTTIEFQREALENAQTNTEVLKNMGYAAKALKAAHSQIGSAVLICAYTSGFVFCPGTRFYPSVDNLLLL